MPISVTSSADRPTREEQIAQLAALVPDDGILRLRFPVQVYDESRTQYTTIRESQWTLSLPKGELTPETVTEILETIDMVMRRIGTYGAVFVQHRLALMEPITSETEEPLA